MRSHFWSEREGHGGLRGGGGIQAGLSWVIVVVFGHREMEKSIPDRQSYTETGKL